MLQWPKPNSLKSLRGFLGLTGYYRRFIKDYGKVSQPLTVLLKKDNFQWTQAAEDAFDQLKRIMCATPFLLDQRVSTPMQHKWLTKLAGYDYEIVYRSGKENTAADALSRVQEEREEPIIMALSFPIANWLGLRYKGRLWLGDRSELKKTILQEAHGGVEGGHSGVKKTLERVRRAFYWKKMRREVCKFVAECDTCQRNKAETIASPGLLQPLPIPELIWSDISMDFIEGLPKSHGKKVIMVVVDSTSYHLQTDGQTEIVNKCLEQYLRCMTGDKPKEWSKWLPLAEWWYNTSFHFSSKITPFEVVYGREPPTYTTYIPGETIVASVDQALKDRDSMIRLLKENLHQAQSKMKKMADKHRTEREFEVDDWVYLRLQPFKQASLALRKDRKLAPRFYGPYKVLQRIGQVAYKLELPSHSKIHPVFHVSCLKKKLGAANVQQTELLTIQEDGRMQLEPLALLEKRTVKRNNRPVVQWLIHWTNSFPEDATWEDACVIRQKFPEFEP
ncbi:hypothetical protein KPL70_017529 [Citrus sinensis]|nr:hypothetical protein KPL70_017529 [Citrus sinensis]